MAQKEIDGQVINFESIANIQTFTKLSFTQAFKAMFGVRVVCYARIFLNRKCTVMHRQAFSYMEDEDNPIQKEVDELNRKTADEFFEKNKDKLKQIETANIKSNRQK
jgi:hypothetical protein